MKNIIVFTVLFDIFRTIILVTPFRYLEGPHRVRLVCFQSPLSPSITTHYPEVRDTLFFYWIRNKFSSTVQVNLLIK